MSVEGLWHVLPSMLSWVLGVTWCYLKMVLGLYTYEYYIQMSEPVRAHVNTNHLCVQIHSINLGRAARHCTA